MREKSSPRFSVVDSIMEEIYELKVTEIKILIMNYNTFLKAGLMGMWDPTVEIDEGVGIISMEFFKQKTKKDMSYYI